MSFQEVFQWFRPMNLGILLLYLHDWESVAIYEMYFFVRKASRIYQNYRGNKQDCLFYNKL